MRSIELQVCTVGINFRERDRLLGAIKISNEHKDTCRPPKSCRGKVDEDLKITNGAYCIRRLLSDKPDVGGSVQYGPYASNSSLEQKSTLRLVAPTLLGERGNSSSHFSYMGTSNAY